MSSNPWAISIALNDCTVGAQKPTKMRNMSLNSIVAASQTKVSWSSVAACAACRRHPRAPEAQPGWASKPGEESPKCLKQGIYQHLWASTGHGSKAIWNKLQQRVHGPKYDGIRLQEPL